MKELFRADYSACTVVFYDNYVCEFITTKDKYKIVSCEWRVNDAVVEIYAPRDVQSTTWEVEPAPSQRAYEAYLLKLVVE